MLGPTAVFIKVATTADQLQVWQLAFALRVGVDKLLECNRNGTLVFVRSDEVTSNRGTLPALRLIFRIDDRQTAIILEGLPSGTA